MNQETCKNDIFYAISGSKKGLYNHLVKEIGFYLPDFGSKCITDSYLEKAYKNQLLIIGKDKVKMPKCSRVCTSQELTLEIQNVIETVLRKNQETAFIELGFDETNPANKEWLMNMLYTLNENHQLFQTLPSQINKEFLEKLEKSELASLFIMRSRHPKKKVF